MVKAIHAQNEIYIFLFRKISRIIFQELFNQIYMSGGVFSSPTAPITPPHHVEY